MAMLHVLESHTRKQSSKILKNDSTVFERKYLIKNGTGIKKLKLKRNHSNKN